MAKFSICLLLLSYVQHLIIVYREVMVLATSGLRGEGVVEGIDWVAQCVIRNKHVR